MLYSSYLGKIRQRDGILRRPGRGGDETGAESGALLGSLEPATRSVAGIDTVGAMAGTGVLARTG